MSDTLPTPSPTASPRKQKVIISSTSFDLPEHRKQVIDGCHRMDFEPLPMEYLTAGDEDAVEASLRLVDEADVYLGVFGHRYGFRPPQNNPDDISITEMEYNRAVERGIPRIIFFMHKEHPLLADDVETGPGADKLKALKDRIGLERVAAFFDSPKDLRAHVVEALNQHRKRSQKQTAADFHYVQPVPELAEPYIAHPYTLLAESRGLVGRQAELTSLTRWVTRPDSQLFASRILFLVAIGGMGKSALTWHWFEKIAPQEMPNLQGRLWWSFYESDATFENFVIRALAYFTQQSFDDVKKLSLEERELRLLHCLDSSPHLVVLDGLERILVAYNRMDAGRLMNDDVLDDETANRVAGAYGLPESAGKSFVGRSRLRLTTDPRAGQFFRKLTHVRKSRILVSTRLYPSDLQRPDGFPVGNCFAYFLPGLSPDDAVDLWRRFGARGPCEELLRLFDAFERHPLLIQTLASEIVRDRRANGDWETWLSQHPDFNPFQFVEKSERKGYILKQALHGLTEVERRLLSTIAAFRMPTTYETLAALFGDGETTTGGDGETSDSSSPPLPISLSPPLLDNVLTDLEDRGLLGWDRRANRYDLHPIVCGVVLSGLTTDSRREIYSTLHAHFEPLQTPDWQQVESVDDLTPAIELFNSLIELERYDDAFTVFRDRLDHATHFRLSASHLRVELAERLFPDGLDQLPRLSQVSDQGATLNVLGQGYQLSGQPGATVPIFRRQVRLFEREGEQRNLSATLCNLSNAQRLFGDVREAEGSARTALQISRGIDFDLGHGVSLYMLGLALAVRSACEPTAPAAGMSRDLTSPVGVPTGTPPSDASGVSQSV
jgi:hypothetical protein